MSPIQPSVENNRPENISAFTPENGEETPPGSPSVRGNAPPRLDFANSRRPTNENPNFVRDYFQSSRLHFIGSFRARYESMMVSVGKQLGINPSVLLQKSIDVSAQSVKRPASQRVIVHIDMDAFFASVAVRDDPSLAGLPVAVCHDAGEVSSCTYEAREKGVRAGMLLRKARELCPSLRTVAYDFDAYERVSVQIYVLFFQLPHVCVEAVSVDEAYLDLTLANASDISSLSNGVTPSVSQTTVDQLVRGLRDRIFAQTGCSASAGIGPSKLIARLATKAAKPNGQFRIRLSDAPAYLDTLAVRDLPGIGWQMNRRLSDMQIQTVAQLRALSLTTLQSEFGKRHGENFHDYARGIDTRAVEPLKPRKSIGAEVSWGVRFLPSESDKVTTFIFDVAAQVALRVTVAGAQGSRVTYKAYKRIRGADASAYKPLGHGPCTILTRSVRLPPRSSGKVLESALSDACLRLHADLRIAHDDFRGIGIQVSELVFADLRFDNVVPPITGTRRIESFFKSANDLPGPAPISSPPTDKNSNGGCCDTKTGSLLNTSVEERKANEDVKYEIDRSELVAAPKAPQLGNVLNDNDNAPSEDLDTKERTGATNAAIEVNAKASDSDIADSGLNRNVLEVQQVVPAICAVADIDETDEIEAVVVDANTGVETRSREETREGTDTEVDGEIPEGWDRDVFIQLPRGIQEELLKQTSSGQALRFEEGPKRNAAQQARIDGSIFGFATRRRRPQGADNMTNFAVPPAERRLKRQRGSAQVTMTQFAEVTRLRRTGTHMVDATEFRERPLRECVELLEDLKGPTRRGGFVRGQQPNLFHRDSSRDGLGNLEIPSPPSLSSDSGSVDGLSPDDLQARLTQENPVYAEEDVWQYAPKLAEWMRETADNVRSAHVELLRGRLLEMLHSRQLQRICEELRTIGRFAQTEDCSSWIVVYNVLVSQVQQECTRLYKFRLNLTKIKSVL